jgi:alpha-beta hydrolase superfamily lysophospholipase
VRAPGRLCGAVVTGVALIAAGASLAFGGTDFYAVPDPLPKGRPGTIIKSEPIAAPIGAQAWRVLYKSRAVDGRDVAVSGVIVAPEGKPPKGGRRVVSWAHGTTGIADVCTPSRRDVAATALPYVDDLVQAGYVVAATDYEGLGTPGVHPYLVGPSEGHGVLDAARAAQRLEGTGAGRDVLVWGHSQGGHAALFAGEIAGRYAPDLELFGVVAGAPAADVETIVPAASGFARAAGFYVLAAKGFAAAYPDEIHEDALFTPEALAASATADQACVIDVIRQFSTFPGPITPGDISQNEALMRRLRQSSAGRRPAGAPLLVIQGTADAVVNQGFTDRLVEQACGVGDVLDYRTYEGAGHSDVLVPAKPDILAWMAARFADDAVTNTCPTDS